MRMQPIRLIALCSALLVITYAAPARAEALPVDGAPTLSSLTARLTPYIVDDFNGPPNSPPDPGLWNIETGGGGWGNKEMQTYTADPPNVRQDGLGSLIIEASDNGGQLTSARINTLGKASLTNGLIAASIRMPAGQGLHPAFWMLGDSLPGVGYPASGEIDIIELVNDPTQAHFAVHGPMVDPALPKWKLSTNAQMPDLSADFHTYWLYKEPGRLTVGIDEAPLAVFAANEVPEGAQWVQDAPFFALLNLAVAGEWPGPLGPGVLPAQMTVDWVRFYQ